MRGAWIVIGGLLGASGVGLGAWSAHGLSQTLVAAGFTADEAAERIATRFEPAVRYQMYHALAIAVATALMLQGCSQRVLTFANSAFLLGAILFSGLLYVMTFAGSDWKWLGAIVPVGGVSYIVGWIALAFAGANRT